MTYYMVPNYENQILCTPGTALQKYTINIDF